MIKERRKHFLINKPLQFRYMTYITITLLIISAVVLISLYIGIWGSVLDSFSDDKIRNDLLIASRLTQYEEARIPGNAEPLSALSLFKQSEKLSQRQREIFKDILDDTHRKLIAKLFLLLIFIAWGSIYLSHKIAGPLYRFHATFQEMQKGNMGVRVKLRKFDEGKFLANDFNHAIENLDNLFMRLKRMLREDERTSDMTQSLRDELAKIKTSEDP